MAALHGLQPSSTLGPAVKPFRAPDGFLLTLSDRELTRLAASEVRS